MGHEEYIRLCPGADKAVLMIHGIVGSPRHFDRFLDAVPEGWSIYNILLDGHGGSVSDFAHTSMAKWKQQVENQLQFLCREYSTVVLLAHSMGTLLSIDAASRHPQVKAMILLNVPLIPRLTPFMAVRSVKLALGKADENDVLEQATLAVAGVTLDKRLWRYVGWTPRFLELFKLCRQIRCRVPDIEIPTYVFQSREDELVSPTSDLYFTNHPQIQYALLENSCHFYYSRKDMETICDCIRSVLDK